LLTRAREIESLPPQKAAHSYFEAAGKVKLLQIPHQQITIADDVL
jgi:hypothetical protein